MSIILNIPIIPIMSRDTNYVTPRHNTLSPYTASVSQCGRSGRVKRPARASHPSHQRAHPGRFHSVVITCSAPLFHYSQNNNNDHIKHKQERADHTENKQQPVRRICSHLYPCIRDRMAAAKDHQNISNEHKNRDQKRNAEDPHHRNNACDHRAPYETCAQEKERDQSIFDDGGSREQSRRI